MEWLIFCLGTIVLSYYYLRYVRRQRILDSTARTFELHQAVRRGDLSDIRRIIDAGQDVNARDSFDETALHIAYKNGNMDAGKLLLKLGADPSLRNRKLQVPDDLLDRVKKKYPAKLFELVKAGDDALGADLRSGFTPDEQDNDGNTALHLAYYAGNEVAVRRLLSLGADPGLYNRYGLTPARMAEVRTTRTDLLRLAALFRPDAPWGTIQLDPSGLRPLKIQQGAERDLNWTNPTLAMELRVKLGIQNPNIYAFAIIMAARVSKWRREVLLSAIRIGRPGSLDALTQMLEQYGSREIANDYLNSGSSALVTAAESWASWNGFQVEYPSKGRPGARWGSF